MGLIRDLQEMRKEFEAKDNEILELFKMCNEKDKEIERLNNIIKEVRDNIDEKLNIHSQYVDYDFGIELLRQELLDILKGVDKE